jgi:hypothetical protein
MPLLSYGVVGGVLLVCLDRCAIVLPHLKAIFIIGVLEDVSNFLDLG